MIEIKELKLHIPDISIEDARYISRQISQRMAETLPGDIDSRFVSRIDLKCTISGNASRREQAAIISDAILSGIQNGHSSSATKTPYSSNNHLQYDAENQTRNATKNPK